MRFYAYENILRNQPTREQLIPDMVICLGQLPTSKSLRNWLDKIDVKRVVVEPRGINGSTSKKGTLSILTLTPLESLSSEK